MFYLCPLQFRSMSINCSNKNATQENTAQRKTRFHRLSFLLGGQLVCVMLHGRLVVQAKVWMCLCVCTSHWCTVQIVGGICRSIDAMPSQVGCFYSGEIFVLFFLFLVDPHRDAFVRVVRRSCAFLSGKTYKLTLIENHTHTLEIVITNTWNLGTIYCYSFKGIAYKGYA